MTSKDETIAKISQYLSGSAASVDDENQNPEFTVEELSQASNISVRNIRAYQDKGILPYPVMKGRRGIYSQAHLSRLKTISNLLDRGYTASSIREVLSGLEEGIGISELIGVESAISSPWSRETPQLVSMETLLEMFGEGLTPDAIKTAIDLNFFVPEGNEMRVTSMQTLQVGAKLCATGIPLEHLLEILRMMRGNVERVANEIVRLVADHVLEPYGPENLPPKEEFPNIAALIWQLRPLAETAVNAELARAMEKAANHILADKLEQIFSTEKSSDTGTDTTNETGEQEKKAEDSEN